MLPNLIYTNHKAMILGDILLEVFLLYAQTTI
nr:MAG TPA: hypothetical protein [Caudoviricetes sp.]DAU94384.1 MAG TPA: hypothetical protein [Caudoviricetes sp.]